MSDKNYVKANEFTLRLGIPDTDAYREIIRKHIKGVAKDEVHYIENTDG